MPQFAYRARDAQGSLVEGVLDCPDRAVAIRQIELQKCIPVRIDLVGPEPKAAQRDGAMAAAPTQNLKIPHGQLLVFTTFMVPQLTGFMAQTGGALPLPTRILLQIHHAITGYWWVGVLVGIGAVVGFRAVVRTS